MIFVGTSKNLEHIFREPFCHISGKHRGRVEANGTRKNCTVCIPKDIYVNWDFNSKKKICIERGACSLALNAAPNLWREVLVQVPVGSGRTMRLCAARTRLFRLIYTQNFVVCLLCPKKYMYVQDSNSVRALVKSSPSSRKAPPRKKYVIPENRTRGVRGLKSITGP